MKTRNTSETHKRIGIISNGSNVVDADWAWRLEQERDEARAQLILERAAYLETKKREFHLGTECDNLAAELKQMSMCLDASNKVCDELAMCLTNPAIFQRMESIDAMCSYNCLPHVIAKGKS